MALLRLWKLFQSSYWAKNWTVDAPNIISADEMPRTQVTAMTWVHFLVTAQNIFRRGGEYTIFRVCRGKILNVPKDGKLTLECMSILKPGLQHHFWGHNAPTGPHGWGLLFFSSKVLEKESASKSGKATHLSQPFPSSSFFSSPLLLRW